jgi:hypothetical protein
MGRLDRDMAGQTLAGSVGILGSRFLLLIQPG